jgi:hypothetical protein
MRSWNTSLRLSPQSFSLLVTDPLGNDLLKARLPPTPLLPRALLTVLEGLALWSGRPIRAVISVPRSCPRTLVSSCFGEDLWPAQSALVEFDFAAPIRRRPRRIRGLGSFVQLRLAAVDEV